MIVIPKSGPSAAATRNGPLGCGAATVSSATTGPARDVSGPALSSGLLDAGEGAAVAWVGIGTTVKGLSQSASVNRPQDEKVRVFVGRAPSQIADARVPSMRAPAARPPPGGTSSGMVRFAHRCLTATPS